MFERLPTPVRSAARILSTTYEEWRVHRTIRLGAGLAYYALFALVPILALALAIAGLFVSDTKVQSYLDGRLIELLGPDAAGLSAQVTATLEGSSTIASLGAIGIVSLLLAASLVVLSLQDALNSIWELPPRRGFGTSLVRRLFAVALVLATGVVLIAGFVVNSLTTLMQSIVPDVVVVNSLTTLFGIAASWAVGVVVIVLLFRYLPDSHAPWLSAVIGGAVTTLGVAIGTAAIGFYLRNYGASSIAGATGSVVFLLAWLYYEAQIILAGAEFTRVLAGGHAENTPNPAL